MSVNQSLKPITIDTNSENHLCVGGCDMIELAKEYGTPLYVIDEQTLRSVCKEYKKSFEKYNNIKMMYASKALCNSAVTRIMDEEGFGFDTVSAGEIYTVYKAGVDMSKVLFNGNNKSRKELEMALDYNVGRFSVDNFYEADLLNSIANEKNKIADILLRLTPGIECHTHEYIQTGQIDSKFGFDLSQVDEIVKLIKNKYVNLRLRGVHAHIGSQIFELKSFSDEVEILIKEIARINDKFMLDLDEMNIGGGIGVKYTEADNPPNIKDLADVVAEAMHKYSVNIPTIYIEPGRSIISTSGVTLYTVGSSKTVNLDGKIKKYIAVDGGMADNPRPSMYQAEYVADVVNTAVLKERKKENVTIAGRFCESGDILIKDIELPELKAGDIICVYNTGAYNYSMASNYNRVEKSAMVLVNNSQSDIIVYRESLEDIISHDNIPSRLRK